MPNKDLLLHYAGLKMQITQAENELKMIKDQVLKEVNDLRGEFDHLELAELPGYKFSIKKLKTWQYSEKVLDLERQYKDQKTLEEQTGATFTEKDSLVFNSPKE